MFFAVKKSTVWALAAQHEWNREVYNNNNQESVYALLRWSSFFGHNDRYFSHYPNFLPVIVTSRKLWPIAWAGSQGGTQGVARVVLDSQPR